jgi:hypothetical protein
MATINELVSKYSKVPGDIRVSNLDYVNGEWFTPFYTVGGVWYGVDETGKHYWIRDKSRWV